MTKNLDIRTTNTPHRVEVLNWKNEWELLNISQSAAQAFFVARDFDDYYVRVVECSSRRKEVWRNFEIDNSN